MSNKLVIVTLCLIILCALMQGESLGQQARRNLALYEKAGPYSLDYEPPWEKREKMFWITVDSEKIITAVLSKRRKPRREITREDYDLIDRVEATGDSSAPSIPEQEVRQPQNYRLRLRNSQTNSVRIF